MNLYLMQHGQATAKIVDSDRPLTDAGRREMTSVADFLARAGTGVARIVHSGKTRARQTAEILVAGLGPDIPLETVTEGLGPTDPTDWLVAAAAEWMEDTLVVGHLPFMARAASRLICGDEDAAAIAFVPGTVVCLTRIPDIDAFALGWMIRPGLLVPPTPV